MTYETKARSLVKTISWRILATLTTMALVYIFIGDMTIALSVGGIEVFLKMLVYFLHERAWDKIKFGKKEVKPAVIWLTGLVRSGKSAIAEEIVKQLHNKGLKAEHLDGHTVRNLFPETGHTRDEVNEHIKRVGYLASKLEEQGVFVVASFVSPFKESREFVRKICNNYQEVYVNTPIETCENRDESGLYNKAKQGLVLNLPGVNINYEEPVEPVIKIDNSKETNKELAFKVVKMFSNNLS